MTTTDVVDDAGDELDRLRAISAEYHVTIRVLAVTIELLLKELGGDVVQISDEALAASPDIRAWRVPEHQGVAITVERPGH